MYTKSVYRTDIPKSVCYAYYAERYRKSAIFSMQRLLNQSEKEKKEIRMLNDFQRKKRKAFIVLDTTKIKAVVS